MVLFKFGHPKLAFGFLSHNFSFYPVCVSHKELIPPDQTRNLTQEDSYSDRDRATVDISDLKTTTTSNRSNSYSSSHSYSTRTSTSSSTKIHSQPTPPKTKIRKVHKTPKTPRVVKRIPFPVDEYDELSKNGNSTVKGTIYVVAPNGKKVYGKNTRLYLNPVTSYSKQWYRESYLNGRKLSKADPRLYNYLRFTASNDKGKFGFYGVPSGRYYIIGIVRCKDECGYSTTKNIRIAKEITVSPNETVNIELSK